MNLKLSEEDLKKLIAVYKSLDELVSPMTKDTINPRIFNAAILIDEALEEQFGTEDIEDAIERFESKE